MTIHVTKLCIDVKLEQDGTTFRQPAHEGIDSLPTEYIKQNFSYTYREINLYEDQTKQNNNDNYYLSFKAVIQDKEKQRRFTVTAQEIVLND